MPRPATQRRVARANISAPARLIAAGEAFVASLELHAGGDDAALRQAAIAADTKVDAAMAELEKSTMMLVMFDNELKQLESASALLTLLDQGVPAALAEALRAAPTTLVPSPGGDACGDASCVDDACGTPEGGADAAQAGPLAAATGGVSPTAGLVLRVVAVVGRCVDRRFRGVFNGTLVAEGAVQAMADLLRRALRSDAAAGDDGGGGGGALPSAEPDASEVASTSASGEELAVVEADSTDLRDLRWVCCVDTLASSAAEILERLGNSAVYDPANCPYATQLMEALLESGLPALLCEAEAACGARLAAASPAVRDAMRRQRQHHLLGRPLTLVARMQIQQHHDAQFLRQEQLEQQQQQQDGQVEEEEEDDGRVKGTPLFGSDHFATLQSSASAMMVSIGTSPPADLLPDGALVAAPHWRPAGVCRASLAEVFEVLEMSSAGVMPQEAPATLGVPFAYQLLLLLKVTVGGPRKKGGPDDAQEAQGCQGCFSARLANSTCRLLVACWPGVRPTNVAEAAGRVRLLGDAAALLGWLVVKMTNQVTGVAAAEECVPPERDWQVLAALLSLMQYELQGDAHALAAAQDTGPQANRSRLLDVTQLLSAAAAPAELASLQLVGGLPARRTARAVESLFRLPQIGVQAFHARGLDVLMLLHRSPLWYPGRDFAAFGLTFRKFAESVVETGAEEVGNAEGNANAQARRAGVQIARLDRFADLALRGCALLATALKAGTAVLPQQCEPFTLGAFHMLRGVLQLFDTYIAEGTNVVVAATLTMQVAQLLNDLIASGFADVVCSVEPQGSLGNAMLRCYTSTMPVVALTGPRSDPDEMYLFSNVSHLGVAALMRMHLQLAALGRVSDLRDAAGSGTLTPEVLALAGGAPNRRWAGGKLAEWILHAPTVAEAIRQDLAADVLNAQVVVRLQSLLGAALDSKQASESRMAFTPGAGVEAPVASSAEVDECCQEWATAYAAGLEGEAAWVPRRAASVAQARLMSILRSSILQQAKLPDRAGGHAGPGAAAAPAAATASGGQAAAAASVAAPPAEEGGSAAADASPMCFAEEAATAAVAAAVSLDGVRSRVMVAAVGRLRDALRHLDDSAPVSSSSAVGNGSDPAAALDSLLASLSNLALPALEEADAARPSSDPSSSAPAEPAAAEAEGTSSAPGAASEAPAAALPFAFGSSLPPPPPRRQGAAGDGTTTALTTRSASSTPQPAAVQFEFRASGVEGSPAFVGATASRPPPAGGSSAAASPPGAGPGPLPQGAPPQAARAWLKASLLQLSQELESVEQPPPQLTSVGVRHRQESFLLRHGGRQFCANLLCLNLRGLSEAALESALKACPCRRVSYCTVECQKRAWPHHKKVCPAATAKSLAA